MPVNVLLEYSAEVACNEERAMVSLHALRDTKQIARRTSPACIHSLLLLWNAACSGTQGEGFTFPLGWAGIHAPWTNSWTVGKSCGGVPCATPTAVASMHYRNHRNCYRDRSVGIHERIRRHAAGVALRTPHTVRCISQIEIMETPPPLRLALSTALAATRLGRPECRVLGAVERLRVSARRQRDAKRWLAHVNLLPRGA